MFLFFAISLKLLAVSQSLFKKQQKLQKFKKFHCFRCFRLENKRKWQKVWLKLCHVGRVSSVYFQKPDSPSPSWLNLQKWKFQQTRHLQLKHLFAYKLHAILNNWLNYKFLRRKIRKLSKTKRTSAKNQLTSPKKTKLFHPNTGKPPMSCDILWRKIEKLAKQNQKPAK